MLRARAWAWLRSRSLAVWLLTYLTAFFVLATLLPYGGLDDPAVIEWAREHPVLDKIVRPLGLYDPYTTPWFLAPALWLALSTSACAIERARTGWGTFRSRWLLTARDARTLDRHPHLRVAARAASLPEALDEACSALRSLRLRVRKGPVALAASANVIGIAGSPLFHAAMAALFVLGLAGWLTRAEGGLNLLLDRPVKEVGDNYLAGSVRGLLFSPSDYSGHDLVLTEIVPQLTIGGVSRGSAIRLEVRRDGSVLARQLVYPNRPLVLGSMVIHFGGKMGPGAIIKVRAAQDLPAAEIPVYFSPSTDEASGFTPQRFTIGLVGGGEFQIEVAVASRRQTAIRLKRGDAWTDPMTAGESESVTLPNGATVTVERLVNWAQVTVVHDWSVPFLYAMFVIGSLGVALTVFVPFRSVKIKASASEPADGRVLLSVVVRAQRSDPGFACRVQQALERAGFERID